MSTALRTYFRGRNLVSMRDQAAGKMEYYHFDHQGTTQCLTDSTGTVTDRFASDAWGVQVERTGSSVNRSWYIGNLGYTRQIDQALDYVRARYLAFTRGRWMSVDPIRSSSLSLYAYVTNHPVVMLDPSGRISTCPFVCTPAGCSCASSGLGYNPPVLGYIIVTPPIRNTPRGGCCAGYSQIQWTVPPGANGWIVQHTTVTQTIQECANGKCTGNPGLGGNPGNVGKTFYEAWEVVNGVVYGVGPSQAPKPIVPQIPYGDQFTELDEYSTPRTCGSDHITGVPRFLAAPWAPKAPQWSFDKSDPLHVEDAGILPTSHFPPDGWVDVGFVQHSLSMNWDCCSNDPTKWMCYVSGVPSLPDT